MSERRTRLSFKEKFDICELSLNPNFTTNGQGPCMCNKIGTHRLLPGIGYLYNAKVRVNVYRQINAEKPSGEKTCTNLVSPLSLRDLFFCEYSAEMQRARGDVTTHSSPPFPIPSH